LDKDADVAGVQTAVGEGSLGPLVVRGARGHATLDTRARGISDLVLGQDASLQIGDEVKASGYRTFMARYPTERLTVAVLCNTTEADAVGLGEKVAALLLPQLTAPAPVASVPSAPAPAPFGFDLAAVAGTYVDPWIGETRVVDTTDGVLHMQYAQSTARPRELAVAGPGDLLVKGGHTHYAFEPAKGKRGAQLTRTSKTEPARTFVRRCGPIDKVDDLAEYEGRFGSDELARDLEIRTQTDTSSRAPWEGQRCGCPSPPSRTTCS
jgi:hypothetical protein